MEYTIISQVNSNFAFNPKISDAFARSLDDRDNSAAESGKPTADQRGLTYVMMGKRTDLLRSVPRGVGQSALYVPRNGIKATPKGPIGAMWKRVKDFYDKH